MAIDWNEVVTLGLTGNTDAELASLLPTLTSGPIQAAKAKEWLFSNDLWTKTPDGMAGILEPVRAAGGELAAFLNQLYALVFESSTSDGMLHTNDATLSTQYATALAGLQSGGFLTSAQVDEFYLLDGGRPFKDVTLAEITAARASHSQADQLRTEYAGLMDAVNTASAAQEAASFAGDRAALVAAIQANRTALQTMATSIEAG